MAFQPSTLSYGASYGEGLADYITADNVALAKKLAEATMLPSDANAALKDLKAQLATWEKSPTRFFSPGRGARLKAQIAVYEKKAASANLMGYVTNGIIFAGGAAVLLGAVYMGQKVYRQQKEIQVESRALENPSNLVLGLGLAALVSGVGGVYWYMSSAKPDSPKKQPLGKKVTKPASKPVLEAKTIYEVGTKVQAKWSGSWWDARIVAFSAKDNMYHIVYDSDESLGWAKAEDLRLWGA